MLVLLTKGTGRSGGQFSGCGGTLVVGRGGAEMKGMICCVVTFPHDVANETGVQEIDQIHAL